MYQIEQLWGSPDHLTTADPCNSNNCANVNDLPAQLSRYVDFKSFVAYTLLPKADHVRWQPDDAKDFVKKLDGEKSSPGKCWHQLAAIWKDVRNRIRQGTLTFELPPRYNHGDVKFVGDGVTSVHNASPHAPGSRERLHYVIQELALPSWEKPDYRESKLGMVVLSIPSRGLNVYRPTILDNFGLYSYFFLPACNNCLSGKTWKLNDSLDENSATNYGGRAEWTAIVQNPGISCTMLINGKPEPAFNLVGLEFGSKHASLFEI